jgi:flagellar hook-basal body complex protein FliE
MTNPIQGFRLPEFENGASFTRKTDTLAANQEARSPFLDSLKSAMDEVASMQSDADGKVAQLLTGNGQDVHSAMIAVEKANLSFQMMVQVRNKIVQAYQQISAMPF